MHRGGQHALPSRASFARGLSDERGNKGGAQPGEEPPPRRQRTSSRPAIGGGSKRVAQAQSWPGVAGKRGGERIAPQQPPACGRRARGCRRRCGAAGAGEGDTGRGGAGACWAGRHSRQCSKTVGGGMKAAKLRGSGELKGGRHRVRDVSAAWSRKQGSRWRAAAGVPPRCEGPPQGQGLGGCAQQPPRHMSHHMPLNPPRLRPRSIISSSWPLQAQGNRGRATLCEQQHGPEQLTPGQQLRGRGPGSAAGAPGRGPACPQGFKNFDCSLFI